MSAIRGHRNSPWAVSIFAVGCLLLALVGCAKGRTATATHASNVANDIPVYAVSVSKFTYSGMPDTVPADKPFTIVFSNNESFPITHELVVVQIPAGKTVDDLVADAKAKGADSEGDWLHFGEIGEVDTGAVGVHTFDLPPGNYAIACWQDGKAGGGTGPVHASIGMAKAFTASASAPVKAAVAAPVYPVSVSKFTYSGMPDTVPADKPFTIVFSNNESFPITHELVVVQIPAGKTVDDLVADAKAKGADSEGDWLHFGEIGEVDTGAVGVHTFDLPPGNYAIACWQDGKAGGGTGPVHASIGMAKAFTASASAPVKAAVAAPVYPVSVSKFTYSGMPDTVPADKPFTIAFSNNESFPITHELVVVQIPAGKTVDDLVADAKAKGADSEGDWLHFGEIGEVDTGAVGVHTFDLPPGNYAIACWQDGKAGGGTGPVHASIGMAKAFTASAQG